MPNVKTIIITPILPPQQVVSVDVQIGAGGGVQSNWDEQDDASLAYIMNKPDLSVYATVDGVAQALEGKQELLEQGANIQIIGNEISAVDTKYTNGDGLELEDNEFSLSQQAKDDIAKGVTAHGWGNHAQAGYLTQHQSLVDYAKISQLPTDIKQLGDSDGLLFDGDYDSLSNKPDLSDMATKTWTKNQGYLTQHQDISQKADRSELPTKLSELDNDSGFVTTDTTYTASDFDISDLADTQDKRAEWDAKQDALTAGLGVSLADNVVNIPEYLTQPYIIHELPYMLGIVPDFLRGENQIWLGTSAVRKLKLDIGDVIEVSGSKYNDGTYTVEDFDDQSFGVILVNYEHRNGRGSLSLTDETLDGSYEVTIKRICKYWLAPLGLGQAWVDVEDGRGLGATVVNSSNRSIIASFSIFPNSSGQWQSLKAEIDGGILRTIHAAGNWAGNYTLTHTTIYKKSLKVVGQNNGSLSNWWELR